MKQDKELALRNLEVLLYLIPADGNFVSLRIVNGQIEFSRDNVNWKKAPLEYKK